MGWFEKGLDTLSSEQKKLLTVKPATAEALAAAASLGIALGTEAYPGDLVVDSVQYEGGKRHWSAGATNVASSVASEMMKERNRR